MREIEEYVNKIISDLPLSEIEIEEMKLEMVSHLEEHVYELLSYGWKKPEAIKFAIQSFGNEELINKEIKKAVFPFYKIVRLLWSAVFMTTCTGFLSYWSMEYYNPEFDNLQSFDYYLGVLLLFTFFASVGEMLFEGVVQEFKLKYLSNPWFFCLIPVIFSSVIAWNKWSQNPENYQNGLWLDLFSVHIAVFFYLLSRELFTLLFVPQAHSKQENSR